MDFLFVTHRLLWFCDWFSFSFLVLLSFRCLRLFERGHCGDDFVHYPQGSFPSGF